jgi:hypothetical protein
VMFEPMAPVPIAATQRTIITWRWLPERPSWCRATMTYWFSTPDGAFVSCDRSTTFDCGTGQAESLHSDPQSDSLPPTEEGAGRFHSSGIPALRRPAKKVVSKRARTFGTPKYPAAFKRAMLEYRPSLFSLRASASSVAARSKLPLRA